MGTLAGHPYLTRAEWGARPPTSVTRFTLPSAKVYVHHTAGHERGAAGMRSIQAMHMAPERDGGRGFRDIAYSFVIDGDDGVIYEGRGPGVQGGHVHGAENRHHGICLMGNYEGEHLTDAARRSLVDLLRHGHAAGWWLLDTVLGHRQEPGWAGHTVCPGRHLFAELPAIRAAARLTTPPPEEDDMPLTDADIPVIRKALRAELAEEGSPSRTVLVELLRGEIASEAGRLNQALDRWASGAPALTDPDDVAGKLFDRLAPLQAGTLTVDVVRTEMRAALAEVHAAAAAAAADAG